MHGLVCRTVKYKSHQQQFFFIAFTIESHPMNFDRICDHLVMNLDPRLNLDGDCNLPKKVDTKNKN
jgi:hypothetical protein